MIPNEAAIREVQEEVGLFVKLYDPICIGKFQSNEGYNELIPPIFMNRHRINENHEHVTLIYFAKSDTDQLVLSDVEVSEDCKWFSKEEIDSDSEIKDHVKLYAKKALEVLSE